ncbi:hypothetical protein ACTWQL_01765 [Pseudalkalibacillus sp. R45]|uniref:hypothetical protein n=1 Tax=Pseudalkalibacillus sp. R45 TaxID=3457433 RepID=UPI003FCC99BB
MDRPKNDICDCCICEIFKGLKPGEIISFVVQNSDQYFEDEEFTFVSFNPKNCCVTLNRFEVNNPVIVDCKKVVGVKIVQNG